MSGSSTIGVVGTTIFFWYFAFLPISKDRKQEHKIKKILSDKENKHTRIFTPHYDSPATAPEKGLDHPQVYGIVVASFDK